MARFAATPDLPAGGMPEWQAAILAALKENVELLCGTRGEANTPSAAVTQGSISVKPLGDQSLVTTTARGNGFTISGSDVASLAEFVKLIADVQTLANDLYYTRQAFDRLISELKG